MPLELNQERGKEGNGEAGFCREEGAVNRAFDHMQIPHTGDVGVYVGERSFSLQTNFGLSLGGGGCFHVCGESGIPEKRRSAESNELWQQAAHDLCAGRPQQATAGGLLITAVHHKARSALPANPGWPVAGNERRAGKPMWVYNHNTARDHFAAPLRRLGPLKGLFINR